MSWSTRLIQLTGHILQAPTPASHQLRWPDLYIFIINKYWCAGFILLLYLIPCSLCWYIQFSGAANLPTYKGDCSNTGKATLSGNAIKVRNIKKSQKITATVDLVVGQLVQYLWSWVYVQTQVSYLIDGYYNGRSPFKLATIWTNVENDTQKC
jgi:hypothetical protein